MPLLKTLHFTSLFKGTLIRGTRNLGLCRIFGIKRMFTWLAAFVAMVWSVGSEKTMCRGYAL